MSGFCCNAIITPPHISTEKEMLKNRGNVIIITKKITSNIIRLNNSGDEVDGIIQPHQLSLRWKTVLGVDHLIFDGWVAGVLDC